MSISSFGAGSTPARNSKSRFLTLSPRIDGRQLSQAAIATRWSAQDWHRTAETVAQMRANRWDVISHCPRCNLTMRVDLALIERYSGATTIFSAVGATVADFAPRCQSDPMCNRFRSKLGWVDWMEDFSQIKIPLRFPDPLPNLREELRPTNEVAIIRPMDPANPVDGMEGAVMRWDLIPSYWKQPIKAKTFLCTNACSETVATTSAFKGAFAKRRCLIPADAFFEQKVAERVRRMSPEALDSLLRDGEDENSN